MDKRSHQERYNDGIKTRKEVLGAEYVDRALTSATDFDRPFQEFMTETCWGMTWGREGLTRKQRSLNKAPFYFSRLLAFEKA